jgi:hypothetical protein
MPSSEDLLGEGSAMPLINSSKKAAFHKNIAELVRTGRPVNQAVVIAFKKKRKAQLEGK